MYVLLSLKYVPLYVKVYLKIGLYKLQNMLNHSFRFSRYLFNFIRTLFTFFAASYLFKQFKKRTDYFVARLYRALIGRQVARMKRRVIINDKILNLRRRMALKGYVYESSLLFYDRIREQLSWLMDFKAFLSLIHSSLYSFFTFSYLKISENKKVSNLQVVDWNINPDLGLKFSKAYLYLDTTLLTKKRRDLLRRYPLDPYYASKFIPIAPSMEAVYSRDQFLLKFPDIEEEYLMHEDLEPFTEAFDMFEWGYLAEEDTMYELNWQLQNPNFYDWLEWNGYPAARRDWLEDIDQLSISAVRNRGTVQGMQQRRFRNRVMLIYDFILEGEFEDKLLATTFFSADKAFFEGEEAKEEGINYYSSWEQFRERYKLRTLVSNWTTSYEYVGFNALSRVHDHVMSLNVLHRNRFEYNTEKKNDFFSMRSLPSTGWIEMFCLIMVCTVGWLIFQIALIDIFYGKANGFGAPFEYPRTFLNLPKKLSLLYHTVNVTPVGEYGPVSEFFYDHQLFNRYKRLHSNREIREFYSVLGTRDWSMPDTLQHPLYNHSYNLINNTVRNWITWKASSPIYFSLWEQQQYCGELPPSSWYDWFMNWYWFKGFPYYFTLIANPGWLALQVDDRTQANFKYPEKGYQVDFPMPWDVPYLKKHGFIPSFLRFLPRPRWWYTPDVKPRYIDENKIWRDHYSIIYTLHDANFMRIRLPRVSIWEEQFLYVVKSIEVIFTKTYSFVTVTLPHYLGIPLLGVPFVFVVSLTIAYLIRGKWFGWTRQLMGGDPSVYFGLSRFPLLEAIRFIYYQSNFEVSNPIFRFLYTIELLKNPKFSRFMLYRHLLYRENPRIAEYFSQFVYPFSEEFLSFKFQFSSFNEESYINSFNQEQQARFWRLWYVATIEDEYLVDSQQTFFVEQFSEFDVEQDEPDEDGGDYVRDLPDYYLRDLEYEVVPFLNTRYNQVYRSKRFLTICAKGRYFNTSRYTIYNDLIHSRVKPFFSNIEQYVQRKDITGLSPDIVLHIHSLFLEVITRYSNMIFKGWRQEEKWTLPKRARHQRKLYRPFYRYMLRGYKESNYLFTYQAVNSYLFDFKNVLLPHVYLGEGSDEIGIYYFNSDYYSRAVSRVRAIAAHSMLPWYGVNAAGGFYNLDRPSRGSKLTTDVREYEMWDFYLSHYEYDHDYMLPPIAMDGYKWLYENETLDMMSFDTDFKLAINEVTAHAEEFDIDLEFDRPLPDDEETESSMFFYSPLGLKLGGVSYFPADYSLKQMQERGFVLSLEECYWAYNQRKTWIDLIECDDDIAPLAAFTNVDFGIYLMNGFFSSRYFNYDMYSEEDGPVYPKVGAVDFAFSEREGFPHPHYHFPYKSYANLAGSWPQSLGRGTYDGTARFILGDLRVEEDIFDKEELLSLRLPPWQAEYLASDPDLRFVYRTWEQNYAVYDNADDFERFHWLMDTHLWITYPLGYAWDSPF